MRAGMNFGDWQVAAFVDNLTDSHTVTAYNWTIDPGDGNSRLERQYTFRPRVLWIDDHLSSLKVAARQLDLRPFLRANAVL